jgi:5-(carboxyamino)imidazole ribonucleotide synthase
MLARAASQLGITTVCLERNAHCPARLSATELLVGDWNQLDSLRHLASRCDVMTLENEFVDADLIEVLEDDGFRVWPTAKTLRLVQDKLVQKQHLAAAGIDSPRFIPVHDAASLDEAASELGYPLVLKRRRNGYDGTGNATVRSQDELHAGAAKLGGVDSGLFAEAWCPFVRELAVIVTRTARGQCEVYPVVETRQKNHVCHEVIAPAELQPGIAERARRVALDAVQAVDMVGCLAAELFLLADGSLLLNELAPRVHNSGHYTIEACACSQFENHVRAVIEWPLGSTQLHSPAVMVNLLGTQAADGQPSGIIEALNISGAHVHLYGKTSAAPGRKMGHVTAVSRTLDQARTIANRAASVLRFDSPLST